MTRPYDWQVDEAEVPWQCAACQWTGWDVALRDDHGRKLRHCRRCGAWTPDLGL